MRKLRRFLARFVDSPPLPFGVYWRFYNWWPAIRGTGGRLTHVASDWTELDVKIPLNWRTRNYLYSLGIAILCASAAASTPLSTHG